MIASSQPTTSMPPANNFFARTLQVLRKHRRRAVLCFLGTMTLVIVGLIVVPRTYRSEAKLFVRMGRESVGLDATATTGKVMSVYESRENEINSVLEVIQSRVILERVVERIGARNILDGRLPQDPDAVAASNAASPGPLRDKAVLRLGKLVRITHPKKSAIISVACKAASPELAQKIVAIVLDEFRALHLKVNRTPGSRQFFESQTKLVAGRLASATAELRDAKNELGLASLEGRRATLQELLRENQSAIEKNASELAGTQATVKSLEQSLAALPQTMLAQKVIGSPNSSSDRARAQLNELQIRERQLLAKFTEHHPDVVAVRQQIAAARRIVAEGGQGDAQSTTAVNPAARQLQLQLLTAQAKAASLKSKAASLNGQRGRLLEELKALNAAEGRLVKLQENVDVLQASHKTYSEKLEQARVDWALGEDRISNVNVVQAPSYVTKPVSPQKRLVVFLGVIVAILASLGVAHLTEYLERRRDSFTDERPFSRETAAAVSYAGSAPARV